MMNSGTIQLNKTQAELINKYKEFGFKNRNELISFAFRLLQKKVKDKKELEQSADLYAELFENDEETQFLTEAAIIDWE